MTIISEICSFSSRLQQTMTVKHEAGQQILAANPVFSCKFFFAVTTFVVITISCMVIITVCDVSSIITRLEMREVPKRKSSRRIIVNSTTLSNIGVGIHPM